MVEYGDGDGGDRWEERSKGYGVWGMEMRKGVEDEIGRGMRV